MKKSTFIILLASAISLSLQSVSCASTSGTKESDTIGFTELEPAKKAPSLTDDEEEFINSLEDVSINFTSAPKVVTVNNNFVKPFSFAVTDKKGNPLPNYNVTVKFPGEKVDGKLIYHSENVTTNEEGKYSYTAKAPTIPAAGDFLVFPTPLTDNQLVVAAAENKAALTPWIVKSDLASKGCILVVWDFNTLGRIEELSSELLSEIRSRGVTNVSNAPFSDISNAKKTVKEIYDSNYEIVGGDSYGYLIYGTINFAEPVKETENGSICSLIADIQVLNMKDGSVKKAATYEQQNIGKGWWDAVSKCKSKLASKIVDSLLYDL